MDAKRTLKTEMDIYLGKYPVLAVTGPRQAGKTTFLKAEFSSYRYVNMENPDIQGFAMRDPNAFLAEYDKYVILDEVQRVPFLFSYIQSKVDEDKIMGQYILSGSQNFLLMQNITQSLAGRVALFKLFPFDFAELRSAQLLDKDYSINLFKGAYPAIYDRDINPKVFYSNYLQTYVERDLSELINIKDLRLFRNFISLCAGRAGQLLNLSSLANDCGITQPTAKAWLSVLETSYIVFQLQPYFSNFNKRITKSTKLYFYDSGLLCHLLKIKDPEAIKTSVYKGNIFENFIIAQFVKDNYHRNLLRDVWFWRDAVGHEVDLIWQEDEKLQLIEIKASQTIMPDMFKGLSYFNKWEPRLVASRTLIHTGTFNQERQDASVRSWYDI